MAFLSLYRKYRPRSFQDLVGQKHVVKTLKNALEHDRIAHAYLFAGPRGTGKTSTAKIFAQSLNCEKGPTTEPCGECESCQQIQSGQSVDVIEIDAASNRGIDEIRDLREKVKFFPTEGKHKVYIIDEVHMLTKGAFNALLKTLEEPPGNVIFILATTEPHKVIDTILSRCQRFDFTLLSSRDIIQRLEHICQKEDVNYDQQSLSLITNASNGGLRDAISLLDQAISYTNCNLSSREIQGMLGKVDLTLLNSFVKHILEKDFRATLKMTGEIIDSGRGISIFVKDLIDFLHQVMIFKECGQDSAIFNFTAEMITNIEETAKEIDTRSLVRFLEILTDVERKLSFADQPRIILELGLIKMTTIESDNSLEEFQARLAKLEERVDELIQGKSFVERSKANNRDLNDNRNVNKDKNDNEEVSEGYIEEENSERELKGDIAQETGNIPDYSIEEIKEKFWPLILNKIKEKNISIQALLLEGEPAKIEDNKLFIQFPHDKGFHKSGAERQAGFIQKTIAQVTGFNFIPVFISEDEKTNLKKKEKVAYNSGSTSYQPGDKEDRYEESVVDKVVKAFNGKIIKVDYEVLEGKENN